MSSSASISLIPRRTSERRRLKMLRNIDQYKISNPYKAQKEIQPIPDELSHQLKKIDYLSSTTIQMLTLQTQTSKDFSFDAILLKMNEAIKKQQDKYRCLINQQPETVPEDTEMADFDSISEDLRKDQCQGEQVGTTRQQISLNLYSVHNHFFGCEEIQEDGLNLLSSQFEHNEHRGHGFKENDIMVMDQEYQHYFAN